MIQLQLAPDKITATLHAIDPDIDELTVKILTNALQQQGVVFGLDEPALQVVISQYNLAGRLERPLVVAEGRNVVDGSATDLQLRYKTGQATVRNGGTTNQIDTCELVAVGSLVAILQPERPGQDGMTVTGKVIPAAAPPDIELSVEQNLELDEQSGRILAVVSGYPELFASTSKRQTILKLTLTPAITLDQEKMIVGLTLRPSLRGQADPDHDQALPCSLNIT